MITFLPELSWNQYEAYASTAINICRSDQKICLERLNSLKGPGTDVFAWLHDMIMLGWLCCVALILLTVFTWSNFYISNPKVETRSGAVVTRDFMRSLFSQMALSLTQTQWCHVIALSRVDKSFNLLLQRNVSSHTGVNSDGQASSLESLTSTERSKKWVHSSQSVEKYLSSSVSKVVYWCL